MGEHGVLGNAAGIPRRLEVRGPTALTAAELAAFILRHRAGLSVAAVVLALDQLSKLLVVRVLAPWESWPAGGPFHLTRAANSGATLDLFSGHSTALVLGSLLAVGVLIALYLPRPKTGVRPQVTFGLMLAGATGNLVDRLIVGHVIDFIDVAPWFIFNVADVAILAGLIGFAWDVPDATDQILRKYSRRDEC